MLETLAVFQPATFWLKADAFKNICERNHTCKQATTTERGHTVPQHSTDGATMPTAISLA